jgi:hypothetical protein
MGGILELIKLIYGSKALSKVLGTRTNVIRLPDNELKQYTKKELNIEAASNKLAQKVKADMYELLAEYPRMNDAEKLIFDGNLRRLGNKLEVVQKKQKPAADVLEFETGEKVSPEGIMSLTEKAGQKNPPTTLMGNLESRIKQLEASGEDLSKMKGQTYDEFMNDITQGQRTMIKLEDEGLVRATAREIIDKDIKSKKIKLPKEVEADFKQGGGEPIDVFRQFYGEDALEQLNSMVPDFRQMYSPREAAEAATKKFNFEFKADRAPGSISIEDARKAEQEFGINKPKQTEVTDITAKVYRNADPDELINEYNKNLNLLSQVDEDGGTLIGYEQFKKLQNRNTEIEKILDSINIKSADSPEGKKITEALIGKPKASVTELVTAEKIISDMKKMDPMDAMKEANKVLKKEGKYKNLKEEDVERIMEDTNDFIFGRDIPEDPEGFATGGRVGFKEGLGYFSNLIKENIPPEYRLYAKSILPGGKKGNVDESYFTEDFKKDLRQQVLTKFKETGKLKGAIGELDTHYRSGAKKYGQGETYPINKLIGLPSTYATLGSYNYEIDPETLDVKIKDTYDWNPAYGKDSSSGKTGWVGDKKGKDVDTSMLKDYVMQSLKTGVIDKGDALELLGNYLGPKASKGEGINVDLDIPAQDISMGEGETFATGGRVRMAGGGVSQGLDYLMGIERRGYQEGSSTLSREEIINRILKEIEPGYENENSIARMHSDDYKTGLELDYLKTLDPDEIKQALDRAYLQGESFQNPDFSRGRIGRGYPFFRYGPEYMKKINYNNPLQLPDPYTGYNLRNQLIELESILGKKEIKPYMTKADDALIDFYKIQMSGDSDLQKKLFGEQTAPTVAEQMISPEDALTPPAPDVNPLQQHFDQNQMLKDAVASGEITPEQYNELGGYDVQQTLSPGNPLLGGIGNLIGSIGYNAVQSYKDKQSFGDAVGDVYRNVKGGLGLISPELKQTYQNIIQQRAPSNIAENINTAVSSLNPFQQQRYINYAVENPDRAIQAAQRDQDFRTAIERRSGPTTPLIEEGTGGRIGIPLPFDRSGPTTPLMASGGRVRYANGFGLDYLLGM